MCMSEAAAMDPISEKSLYAYIIHIILMIIYICLRLVGINYLCLHEPALHVK